MWNDLELYHDYRDFTTDPTTFPAEEMRNFIRVLVRRLVPLQDSVGRTDLSLRTRMGNTVCNFALLGMQLTHAIDIPIVHGYAALVTKETDIVSESIQEGFCLTEDPSSTILSFAEPSCERSQISVVY